MVKFLPESLGTRVILKPRIEKVSKGGIYIARDERSQAINTNQGEVFMMGPDCWSDLKSRPNIKVGDTVYYAHYGAMTLKPDESEDFYIICNDVDILVGYVNE